MRPRPFVIALAASLLSAATVAAQITTSTITGRVVSASGAPVAGVTVAATYGPTGARYGTQTRDDGRFTLANLRAGGPYKIETRRIGYRQETREKIFVALGTEMRVDFNLEEAATTLAAVTVTAGLGSNVFDSRRTGTQTSVDQRQIENVPTLSRGLQDVTKLTPSGNANSFGGTNFRYNNITIDGAASNDVFSFSNSYGGVSGVGPSGTPGAGAKTQPISLDAIDAVHVVVAPYDVKLGNFTGASINAVTRSGANDISGSVYSFGRNQLLTGKSADDARTAVPKYSDYQFGGRIGGPIARDKVFYFLNAEFATRKEPLQFAPGDPGTLVTAAQAQALNDTVKARLGFNSGAIGPYEIASHNTKLFGRLDFNLGDNNKLNVRHNFINASAANLTRGLLNVNFGSQDFVQRNRTNSTVAELNSTLGNGISNQLITSMSFTRDRRDPVGEILPQIEINGLSGSSIFLGTNREAAIFRINTNVLELTDNLTIAKDRHTFTVGTHNEVYGIQYFFQNAWNGRWQYSSIANFNANKPSRVRGTYALGDNSYDAVSNTPSADFKVIWPSAYVQDEIAVTNNFHITPGIRIDVPIFPDKPAPNAQFLATSYNGQHPFAQYDETNIGGDFYAAPRLSFNWDTRGDHTLQLRGGTGLFTGRVPFAWYAYAYYNNGVRFNNVDCRPGPTAGCAGNSATVALVPGQQLSSLQKGVYEMNVIDNNFKLPTVVRTSGGIDYKLGTGTVLTLEGSFTKSLQDVKFLNVGLKDSTITSAIDGRPIFQGGPVDLRVNPNITSVFVLTNTK
ncbi:MAG TPA: carboxypeptidase regulatory-like domain-containing protein, partial [Gemmatimonadaceae bacterium]|nr:carboxypeptidase regulatory-like domain-containing protein [Gemmatimonadaceae bacterium]